MLAFARSATNRAAERQTARNPSAGVLGQRRVAHDAQRQAVGDAVEAVVQLRQRLFVGARDERDQRLVREVSEPPSHDSAPLAGRAQR